MISNASNRITKLFGIKYPIISGGMVWCSGWKLASAVSNAGGLGLIGSGSMTPDLLSEHIKKCKAATDKPFGVNVPMMLPEVEKVMKIIIDNKVPVVFTSAGNPKTWTKTLKNNGIKVVHVTSSSKFAIKSQEAGVDAVVAEGFEAGGHNGAEETSTMTLIPHVRKAVDIPLIAAGGIGTGGGMLAAMALGAEGIQVGTRFAMTQESSAHENFKKLCASLKEGDTMLSLKKIVATRLIKNDFYKQVKSFEDRGASYKELSDLLGRGRSRKGMFLGDMKEGELEIGQIASLFKDITSAKTVVERIVAEYNEKVKAGYPVF
ncbi:oxidoreductase, 2-nitropropane dioxygenase family protein [Trichomonas vaginalis G3]|uniref:Oxidoreductase, 2-nitropropane dioxygenase family protein n=1 Tax=Trichomonas vaginalis (strain ATCC PRA-98 / G3) TaxID=412133 RepID=A2FLN0_TRIV3|nr:nitronate monooxygenase family [Trichomonas vaginalis G3]EAX94203.1 oxidoreductase, 2-nitropropane dioxygenase family protein [Trichomonas vaginalis G3]KAI5498396.1 nitronate monooxygenase family [Trichomonas vaginalis G3]|eukprot:XP_001307133.1 oxidoreductase, 2-nitropropane dioxygenase family protein [Trichomonas vaginalis G3]